MMGRLHASLSVATLLGAGLGAGAAALGIPVAAHVGAVAVVLVVVLLLGVASLNSMNVDADPGPDRSDRGIPTDDLLASATVRRGNRRDRARMWLILLVAGLVAVLIELPAQEWSGLLLARELSTSAFIAGLGPFIAVGGVTLGRLVLDPTVDRFGWRRVAQGSGVLSVLGTVAGLALGSTFGSAGLFLAGIGVAALGAGVAAPLLFDRAAGLAQQVGLPADAGPGLVSGVFRLGVLVSPLMVAALVEVSGLFVAMGVPAVAGALLVLLAGPLTAGPGQPE